MIRNIKSPRRTCSGVHDRCRAERGGCRNKCGMAVVILIGFLFSSSVFAASSACLIAIDAGHYHDAPGAISARGTPELTFNLNLAEKFKTALDKRGIRSFLTNPDGDVESLVDRPLSAEKAGATLFISLHHDSVEEFNLSTWQWQGEEHHYCDRFHGYSFYVSKRNPHFKESLRAAKIASDKLLADGLTPALYHADPVLGEGRPLLDKKRGIYNYNKLAVVMFASMPAMLVEAGVIVNRDEELLVETPEYQDKIVSALTAAAVDHCDRLGNK
jgi:N-acetylmuramoyl-L-alanine amidase